MVGQVVTSTRFTDTYKGPVGQAHKGVHQGNEGAGDDDAHGVVERDLAEGPGLHETRVVLRDAVRHHDDSKGHRAQCLLSLSQSTVKGSYDGRGAWGGGNRVVCNR